MLGSNSYASLHVASRGNEILSQSARINTACDRKSEWLFFFKHAVDCIGLIGGVLPIIQKIAGVCSLCLGSWLFKTNHF